MYDTYEKYDNHNPHIYCGGPPSNGEFHMSSVWKNHKPILSHLVDDVHLVHTSLRTNFTMKW